MYSCSSGPNYASIMFYHVNFILAVCSSSTGVISVFEKERTTAITTSEDPKAVKRCAVGLGI